MGVRWEWESFHQEWDGTGLFFLLEWGGTGEKIFSHVVLFLPGVGRCWSSSPAQPCVSPTQITSLASLLLAITVADANVDCSEPPSGKSSHPAPSPERTCSASARRSPHPKSEKLTCRCAARTYGATINWRSCNMFRVRHPCSQLSATGVCPPQQCAQAWLAGRDFIIFFPPSFCTCLVNETRRSTVCSTMNSTSRKHTHTGFLLRDCLQRFLLESINNNNVMQMQCSLHSAASCCGLK